MPITGQDKRRLKALGQTKDDDVRLGQAGLSEGFLANLDTLFKRQELVKLRFTELRGEERKELADMICQATEADLVGILGRTMLLYRPNPDLPPEQRALGG